MQDMQKRAKTWLEELQAAQDDRAPLLEQMIDGLNRATVSVTTLQSMVADRDHEIVNLHKDLVEAKCDVVSLELLMRKPISWDLDQDTMAEMRGLALRAQQEMFRGMLGVCVKLLSQLLPGERFVHLLFTDQATGRKYVVTVCDETDAEHAHVQLALRNTQRREYEVEIATLRQQLADLGQVEKRADVLRQPQFRLPEGLRVVEVGDPTVSDEDEWGMKTSAIVVRGRQPDVETFIRFVANVSPIGEVSPCK